ncbi:MAG: UbiA family prenyltransferase [Verrucomicrobia bacterium]|nr:UbiA family prenyltransferase [Verrucomicrobiota bacterium]
MSLAQPSPFSLLRTLLVLGRASNLPTVWSNCLAGWLLSGGGVWKNFLWLCFGATCLYTGGMYLNDAIDANFDLQFRRERPIPSGAIKLETVWLLSGAWLIVGMLMLASLGKVTALLAVCLLSCIVLYDFTHKAVPFSPAVMAACRFFLYLVASASAARGLSGWATWSALGLAAYIIGLSYLARKESTRGPVKHWPVYLLATPIGIAALLNDGDARPRAALLSVLLALWILRCLRQTFWSAERNVGATVSGLLAGIVLVDLLAVIPDPYPQGLIFLLLFGAGLLFQRIIPAT